jgi:hypothetical protein
MAGIRHIVVSVILWAVLQPLAHAALDHSHAGFDALLRRHVAWNAAGTASGVSYAGFAADRAELRRVLEAYSAVDRAEYEAMTRDQRLAFLVNVYNAFTIELVLTRWPDLKSIRDLGSLLQSAWKRRFFRLLGEERHLDDVEHGMIRAPGAFDEPRIHFVVNCASIGCPALRPEALVADRLEAQLEDSTRRFLRDASRNRYDPRSRRLEVSKIFDWFRVDWERGGPRGYRSREQFFARYADLLADDPADRARIREQNVPLGFLEYDWGLNGR